MPVDAHAVDRYYGQADVGARVLAALRDAGKDSEHLAVDDLAPYDQLHNGGRESTRALARLAGLGSGMRVLDVGSGIGGPARTLAAEFGCEVVGIDLTQAFVAAAEMLTARVGLSERVRFQQGNALALPFNDGSFDAVWTQNVLMNIEDKQTLFQQMFRVLRPGGRLGVQTVLAGPTPGLHYPVPWATDPSMSFLVPPPQARQWLLDSGFAEILWQEMRAQPQAPGQAPPPPNALFATPSGNAMFAAMKRNGEEGRVVNYHGVFERPVAS